MNQITIFDFVPEEKPKPPEICLGYQNDNSIVGKPIPFTELKNYIGKKVVIISRDYIKVYAVIEYLEKCDTYYKRVKPLPENQMQYGEIVNGYIHDIVGIKECMNCYEPAFTCDRVALSDKNMTTANSWISEVYCRFGRYDNITDIETDYEFHELIS